MNFSSEFRVHLKGKIRIERYSDVQIWMKMAEKLKGGCDAPIAVHELQRWDSSSSERNNEGWKVLWRSNPTEKRASMMKRTAHNSNFGQLKFACW